MSIYETISAPFRYVDSLKKMQHILLLYEDQEYARLIEYKFLKNGLVSGENCVYVTDEDSGSMVLKFLSYGMPLHYFQSGKFRILQVHDMSKSKDTIYGRSKKDLGMILEHLMPPFRIAGRIVPDVNTLDGISVEMELERNIHSLFDDTRGSILCTYDVSKIEKTYKKQWLEELRESHHCMIYATKFGQGGVFHPD